MLYVVLPENASFVVASARGGQEDPEEGDGKTAMSSLPRFECTVSLQVQCGNKFVQHVSIPGDAFVYVPEKSLGHDSNNIKNNNSTDTSDATSEQHWTLAPPSRLLASSIGSGGIEPKLLAWRFPSIFTVPKDRNEDMEYFRAGAERAAAGGGVEAAVGDGADEEAHNYDADFFGFHPRNCRLLPGGVTMSAMHFAASTNP